MADVMPKLTDVKNLQDLSKILAWPMLAVAYFLISGPQISVDGSIWFGIPDHLSEAVQTRRFFLIFGLKAIWSGGIALLTYKLIAELHFELYLKTNFLLFPVIAALLFAYALLSIFGHDHFIWLQYLNSFWAYAAIVWGFFLLAMTEQLVDPLEKGKRPSYTALQLKP